MLTHNKGKRGSDKTNKVGLRFGRLLVLECIEPSNGLHYGTLGSNKRGLWKCLCDCGNEVNIHGSFLITSKNGTKSCGCLQKEAQIKIAKNRRAPDRVTINAQYLTHKNKGIKKGLGFLEKEKWLSIVFQPCHYCGEIDTRNNLLYSNFEAKSKFTEEEIREYDKQINGIDRIDSTKGYELDNCRPCCKQCNTLKMDYTEDEFFNKISLIHNRHSYKDVSLESLLCN